MGKELHWLFASLLIRFIYWLFLILGPWSCGTTTQHKCQLYMQLCWQTSVQMSAFGLCMFALSQMQNQISDLSMHINHHSTSERSPRAQRSLPYLASALISVWQCMCEHGHMRYIKSLEQKSKRIARTEEDMTLVILVSPSARPGSPAELSARCCCCSFTLQQMATLIWFHSTLIGK